MYPNDNGTYHPQPVYPIIFAVQNAAAFWPLSFGLVYELEIWADNSTDPVVERGGFSPDGLHQRADSPPPEDISDPFLIINKTEAFANVKNGHAVLTWHVGYFDISISALSKTTPSTLSSKLVLSQARVSRSAETLLSPSRTIATNPFRTSPTHVRSRLPISMSTENWMYTGRIRRECARLLEGLRLWSQDAQRGLMNILQGR